MKKRNPVKMKIMFGKHKYNNLMSGIEVAMKPDSAITFMS